MPALDQMTLLIVALVALVVAGGVVVVAVEAHRSLADAFDQVENVGAFLGAHGVAKDAAEHADIVAQRGVLVLIGEGGVIVHAGSEG